MSLILNIMETKIKKSKWSIFTPEQVAIIIKHRDNMIKLERSSRGEQRDFIHREIFDCRRFINRVHRERQREKKKGI